MTTVAAVARTQVILDVEQKGLSKVYLPYITKSRQNWIIFLYYYDLGIYYTVNRIYFIQCIYMH